MKNMGLDYRLANDHRVGDVIHNTNGNPSGWVHLKDGGNNMKGNNATIDSLTLKGESTKFEINNTGNTTINTLNNDGLQLNLRNNNLKVTTLNQNSSYTPPDGNANTKILGSATITTLNQNAGSTIQQNGTITTANLNGGTFTQSGGEITTANLSGGVFTHNGGTLTNVVLKAGGSGSTFVNETDSAFANITQEGGNHTIIGKVAKFTTLSSVRLLNLL